MPADASKDRRLEVIRERLQDELVDDQGDAVDPGDVAQAVDEAATLLADAPIQEFAPLLIEHHARDTLHDKGFHPDFGDAADDAPAHDSGKHDESVSIHLASHQGTALPEPK